MGNLTPEQADELQATMDQVSAHIRKYGGVGVIDREGKMRPIRFVRLRAWLAHPGFWIPRRG